MVILSTKIYGDQHDAALQSLQAMVADEIGSLDVTFEIGVRHDGFPSVTLDGPDATVARNHLASVWGEITTTFETDGRYHGTLESWSDEGFHIDCGDDILISADHLGLGQGTPDQIATRFGLVRHMPMRITYGSPTVLADEELDRLYDWRRGPGRVNANGVTRSQLRATVNRAGHANDIVTIERLGLLEQSIICQEGTDPPGLLASIGSYLPGDLACVR